jgi:hypothetical protein
VIDEISESVSAALGAVIDPHGRHSERFRRRKIGRHVVGKERLPRLDPEALAE